MENVCGLVHFKDSKGFVLGRLIGKLLGWGYSVKLEVLQAQYYGVPSQRRRLILQAARPGTGGLPPPAVQVSADGWEFFKQPGTDRPVFSRTCSFTREGPVQQCDERSDAQLYPPWAKEESVKGSLKWLDGVPCGENNLELRMPFLTVQHAIGDLMDVENISAKQRRKGAASVYPQKTMADCGRRLGSSQGGFESAEDQLASVRRYQRLCRLGSPQKNSIGDHFSVGIQGRRGRKRDWLRLRWGDLGPTVTSNPDPLQYRCVHPCHDRALTVREAARLQGFQDRAGFAAGTGVQERYKQVANAVPPPLAYRLARAWVSHLCEDVLEGGSEGGGAPASSSGTKHVGVKRNVPWVLPDDPDGRLDFTAVLRAKYPKILTLGQEPC